MNAAHLVRCFSELCFYRDEIAQDDVMNNAYWIFDFEWFTVRSCVTYDLGSRLHAQNIDPRIMDATNRPPR